MKKSKQRVEQDYARNAIRDYETGHKKAAKYEKKKELELVKITVIFPLLLRYTSTVKDIAKWRLS